MRTKYVTFGEMEGNAIVEVLKDTDILVTTYGEDSVFLLFMVPYSVLVEVQSDYFHDVTTSVMAYACDIYPIILRDVYSSIPAECTMRDNVVESEKEPCRSLLLARDIVFDVKSMTQAMYQSQYYLNNYKMKPVSYCCVSSTRHLYGSQHHNESVFKYLVLLKPNTSSHTLSTNKGEKELCVRVKLVVLLHLPPVPPQHQQPSRARVPLHREPSRHTPTPPSPVHHTVVLQHSLRLHQLVLLQLRALHDHHNTVRQQRAGVR